jgi:hypothetical protein
MKIPSSKLQIPKKLQVPNLKGFGRRSPSLHRSAMPAISRGLRIAATIPPVCIEDGNEPVRGHNSQLGGLLASLQDALAAAKLTGGIATAQPPANRWQAFGLLGSGIYLELGAWSFFGIWSLGFGAFPT